MDVLKEVEFGGMMILLLVLGWWVGEEKIFRE